MQNDLSRPGARSPRENPRRDRALYRFAQGSSQRVFSRYIELFSTKRRRVVLGSSHKWSRDIINARYSHPYP
jgi:hypothetical protein